MPNKLMKDLTKIFEGPKKLDDFYLRERDSYDTYDEEKTSGVFDLDGDEDCWTPFVEDWSGDL